MKINARARAPRIPASEKRGGGRENYKKKKKKPEKSDEKKNNNNVVFKVFSRGARGDDNNLRTPATFRPGSGFRFNIKFYAYVLYFMYRHRRGTINIIVAAAVVVPRTLLLHRRRARRTG